VHQVTFFSMNRHSEQSIKPSGYSFGHQVERDREMASLEGHCLVGGECGEDGRVR
jgi:hypothetical protein